MGWFTLAQQSEVINQSWLTAGLLLTLLAMFAADKILGHLKTRGIDLQKLVRHVKELHEWHNHDDPDQPGVKIWYNQKYQAELLKEMVAIQRDQTNLLKEMHREQHNNSQIQVQQTELLSALIKTQEAILRRTGDEA